jgi:hypothetical protein
LVVRFGRSTSGGQQINRAFPESAHLHKVIRNWERFPTTQRGLDVIDNAVTNIRIACLKFEMQTWRFEIKVEGNYFATGSAEKVSVVRQQETSADTPLVRVERDDLHCG